MENVKEYVLYLGKYVKEEYAERFKDIIRETGISCDVVQLDSEFDEASRSVSNNGVALYCYFVKGVNAEVNGKPDASKICDKGMGMGVALMNRNFNTYLYQFKEYFKNMKEIIQDTCLKLSDSIIWCEEHLSVNF